MSLKSLIQRLLDSRTTPEEAGHSAMPTTTEITSQSFAGPFSSWGPVASGTASEDGYIYAAGAVATSGSNSEFRLDNGQFGSYITSTWGTQGLLLPVMKGQFWRLYATNRKDVVIRLYRLVGGGYNCLVRRALSCLKPSFNFSPKVFSKAKRRGYLSGRSNWLIPRQSLKYQRQTLGQSSQCRLTVGQLLKAQTILQRRLTATSLKGNTKCSVFASVVSPIALQQFLFRAKKAKPSALPFTQTVRTFPLEHLKHFRLANLETGGALC